MRHVRIRRMVIALAAVAPLAFGVATAQAWSGGGVGPPAVAVAGTIVSVNPTAGTFVANAYELGPRWGRGFGFGYGASERMRENGVNDAAPTTTQVTITTTGSTRITVDGQTTTISGLAGGDTFRALFSGSPGTDITTLVSNNPALAVSARVPPQLYAFVGTVTAVTPASTGPGGTIGVDVSNSIPSGLVSSSSNPVTFTVGPDTLILGGNASGGLFGATLSGISVGDVVAGGLIATADETLSQVESSDLKLLVDFPVAAPSSPSSTSTSTVVTKNTKSRALKKAAKLLGIKISKRSSKGSKRAHKARNGRASKRR